MAKLNLRSAKQTTKGNGKSGAKADKKVKSKRVGWRFSDAGAKKAGIPAGRVATAVPTAKDIEKGRAYWENRKNRSDDKPAKKFGLGGMLGLGV
jgi:hypothetical protein